jgi:protease-4
MTGYGMSDPARENLQALLDSLYGQLVAGIAESRGFDEAEVRQLVDGGPYLAQEALEKRLIDRIGYWDEFIGESDSMAGEEAESVFLDDYLAGIDRPNSEGPKVALIYGNGTISMGSGDDGDGFEGGGFKAHRVAEAFADAIDDEEVEAILFRINSPGGSYVASDIVWREVGRAKEAGKPVIVSMGATAASGGYFVAMPADRVIAQPGTVTGSIGVYGGKLITEKLWARFGIAWDELHAGENAGMWSFIRDFPAGGEERFRQMLDFIYGDFTAKAMENRNLDAGQMDRIARAGRRVGRLWRGDRRGQAGAWPGRRGRGNAGALAEAAVPIRRNDETAARRWQTAGANRNGPVRRGRSRRNCRDRRPAGPVGRGSGTPETALGCAADAADKAALLSMPPGWPRVAT